MLASWLYTIVPMAAPESTFYTIVPVTALCYFGFEQLLQKKRIRLYNVWRKTLC